MENKNVKIIVSVSSCYKDIADLFFYCMKKNWPDCPFDCIVSFNDEKFNQYSKYSYVGQKKDTIPDNIRNITNKYKADFYICLLGDAFISNAVNTKNVLKLIKYMEINKISYCNLFPLRKKNKLITYIKNTDVYSMSFIAFIASNDFINKEFKNGVTDFEFEEKWLKSALENSNQKYVLKDKIINSSNILNIVHGIQKGVWIRKSYNYMKKNGLLVNSNRNKMSIIQEIIFSIRVKAQIFLPPKFRYVLKKLLSKCGMKFSTTY